MAKKPAKIEVSCPHCGHLQAEPARVQSTYCRKCGQHFDTTARVPEVQAQAPAPQQPSSKPSKSSKPPGSGLFHRAQKLWSKKGPREAHCFECGTEQIVPPTAKSTICPACSAYIDLTDFEITGPFTRNIRTRGDIHLGPKGDLSSTRTDCTDALIEGRLRGDLLASGTVRLACKQKIIGILEAKVLKVERKADTECARPVRCRQLEVQGKLVIDATVDGSVLIKKHGYLRGSVRAKSIQIEKGGAFDGELRIAPPPESESSPASAPMPANPPPSSQDRPKPMLPMSGSEPALAV